MKPKLKRQSPVNPEIDAKGKNDNIVFSFSNLQQISYVDATKDAKFFIQFINRLQKISTMTWTQAYTADKHAIGGLEPMPVKQLRETAQNLVPAGVDTLQVMRATGENKVFLGLRDGDIYSHN